MKSSQRHHRRNYNESGHAHELTFSCYRNWSFLKSDRTCHWLAESINAVRNEQEVDVWCFVFMPDHVHLILHPRRAKYNMAEIRKAIKEPVGRKAIRYLHEHAPEWLPKVTRRRGKREERLFWQSGGGYDRNIYEPNTLMQMIDYIHLNPVRRGFIDQATNWHWSSAGHFQGGKSPLTIDQIPPEWLDENTV